MSTVASTCAVLGLGQVGLPLATALAERHRTFGIDLDADRLLALRQAGLSFEVSEDGALLAAAEFIFVTLPTDPQDTDHFHGSSLEVGCRMIGRQLKPGTTIVFESTVSPGTTENWCIPVLESSSGLAWKKDFFVAYSPERINPGDQEHTLLTIPKLLAADCSETLERVAAIYESVIPAGVHRLSSIRVAELTKLLENVQRDLNIALMNDLSMVAHGLQIDSAEVLQAARTKWNFVPFQPGLVGGECLSLASHFWEHTRSTLQLGPGVVGAGRDVNRNMAGFVIEQVSGALSERGVAHARARIVVLGATFKANVSSMVGSQSLEVARRLGERGMEVWVHDPVADFSRISQPTFQVCGATAQLPEQCDVLVLAVAHRAFEERSLAAWCAPLRAGGLVVDLAQRWDGAEVRRLGYEFWQL